MIITSNYWRQLESCGLIVVYHNSQFTTSLKCIYMHSGICMNVAIRVLQPMSCNCLRFWQCPVWVNKSHGFSSGKPKGSNRESSFPKRLASVCGFHKTFKENSLGTQWRNFSRSPCQGSINSPVKFCSLQPPIYSVLVYNLYNAKIRFCKSRTIDVRNGNSKLIYTTFRILDYVRQCVMPCITGNSYCLTSNRKWNKHIKAEGKIQQLLFNYAYTFQSNEQSKTISEVKFFERHQKFRMEFYCRVNTFVVN